MLEENKAARMILVSCNTARLTCSAQLSSCVDVLYVIVDRMSVRNVHVEAYDLQATMHAAPGYCAVAFISARPAPVKFQSVRNGSLQVNLPCFESDVQFSIYHLSTVIDFIFLNVFFSF